jgi:hypothetical protein
MRARSSGTEGGGGFSLDDLFAVSTVPFDFRSSTVASQRRVLDKVAKDSKAGLKITTFCATDIASPAPSVG